MHSRNADLARHIGDPKEVPDEHYQRSHCEGLNGHAKMHFELEDRFHAVGSRTFTRHVVWTSPLMHVVAMMCLQHGVTCDLLLTTHIL